MAWSEGRRQGARLPPLRSDGHRRPATRARSRVRLVERSVEIGVLAEAANLAVLHVEDVDRAVPAPLAAPTGSISAYNHDDEVVAEFAETFHNNGERIPRAAHEVEEACHLALAAELTTLRQRSG